MEDTIGDLMDYLNIFEKKLLAHLSTPIDLKKAQEVSGLQELQVLKAAQWLSNKELAIIKELKKKTATITERGIDALNKGLPETRLLEALKDSSKK